MADGSAGWALCPSAFQWFSPWPRQPPSMCQHGSFSPCSLSWDLSRQLQAPWSPRTINFVSLTHELNQGAVIGLTLLVSCPPYPERHCFMWEENPVSGGRVSAYGVLTGKLDPYASGMRLRCPQQRSADEAQCCVTSDITAPRVRHVRAPHMHAHRPRFTGMCSQAVAYPSSSPCLSCKAWSA